MPIYEHVACLIRSLVFLLYKIITFKLLSFC